MIVHEQDGGCGGGGSMSPARATLNRAFQRAAPRHPGAAVVLLGLLIVAGCAMQPYRAFEGNRSVDEVARVEGELIRVGTSRTPEGTRHAELLPGEHSLLFQLDYVYETSLRVGVRIRSQCGAEATLLAGRSYEIRAFVDAALPSGELHPDGRLPWGAGLFDSSSDELVAQCRCLTDKTGEWSTAACEMAYGGPW
jgi:hypothetical protein